MRKPKLVISKCLNSEKCRYDGQGYDDKVIALLKDYIDIETVCPEKGIGLTTPREPIRIEKHGDINKLVQLKSNMDYTSQMTEFAEEFLNGIDDVDGFILKSRSPSCGIKNVKIYPEGQKCCIAKNGTGLFAEKAKDYYPNIPIEDEGRLKNYDIRDEFLTKIFTINDLKCEKNIKEFHKKNSLLLDSYDNRRCLELSSIISKNNLTDDDITLYKNKIYQILNHKRSKNTKVNICMTVFERYKDKLKVNEIEYFEKLINSYNDNKIPFSSIIVALQMYTVRFDDNELLNQTFFHPYPEELVSTTDSGKGRNL